MVLVGVSHPFVFGAVVMQSAHAPVHAYAHVAPLQLAVPCVWSHALPHPPQLVIVVVAVSHPFVSGAV